MRLQLFQLTRKCGHLHAEKGDPEGGRGGPPCLLGVHTPPRPVTLPLSARPLGPDPRKVPDTEGPSPGPWHLPWPRPSPALLPLPPPAQARSQVPSFLAALAGGWPPISCTLDSSFIYFRSSLVLGVSTSSQTCRASLRKGRGTQVKK